MLDLGAGDVRQPFQQFRLARFANQGIAVAADHQHRLLDRGQNGLKSSRWISRARAAKALSGVKAFLNEEIPEHRLAILKRNAVGTLQHLKGNRQMGNAPRQIAGEGRRQHLGPRQRPMGESALQHAAHRRESDGWACIAASAIVEPNEEPNTTQAQDREIIKQGDEVGDVIGMAIGGDVSTVAFTAGEIEADAAEIGLQSGHGPREKPIASSPMPGISTSTGPAPPDDKGAAITPRVEHAVPSLTAPAPQAIGKHQPARAFRLGLGGIDLGTG